MVLAQAVIGIVLWMLIEQTITKILLRRRIRQEYDRLQQQGLSHDEIKAIFRDAAANQNDEMTEVIDCYIEQHGQLFYAFETKSDRFIGQSGSVDALKSVVLERFRSEHPSADIVNLSGKWPSDAS